jgi:repressor LexA
MKQIILSQKESKVIRHIRNALVHEGKIPSVRELMRALGYRSPRSVSLLIENLIEKKYLRKKDDGSLQFIQNHSGEANQTVDVSLVGTGACGLPMLAEENVEAYFPVSTKIAKPPSKYFFLRAKGDSMNEAGINDRDLVLVKQQSVANNGDIIVALIDEEATIKEFNQNTEMIILKPKSSNKTHKPIILTKDFAIQGIVVTSIADF